MPTAANMPQNDLLLRTLRGETTERPPVWMMRQAGRYLPEYQVLRAKYGFFERVQTPALAAEITVQPVDLVGVDAAILFSDILVMLQAFGVEVLMEEGKGPVLPNPVKTAEDAFRFQKPDAPAELHYVMAAIGETLKALGGRVPLIGFAGAPWTLLCYWVEGRGSKAYDKARAFCFTQPKAAHHLLQLLTDATVDYLNAQIAAGAHVVQVFDSWAGMLAPDDFMAFSYPYLKQIAERVTGAPVILFARGAEYALGELAATPAAALGLNWAVRPQEARRLAPGKVLQGNFDPARLLTSPAEIQAGVRKMAADFGPQRYIANLGHGILPNVPPDNARAFVDAVKSL